MTYNDASSSVSESMGTRKTVVLRELSHPSRGMKVKYIQAVMALHEDHESSSEMTLSAIESSGLLMQLFVQTYWSGAERY